VSGADVQRLVADVLLWAGVGVAAASGVALVVLRTRTDRIHALTPLTSIAAPLVTLAVAVDLGWQRTTVKVLLIGLLTVVGGAVLASATGQSVREADDVTSSEGTS
jgi:multicomponent Na+:H+ antiporter subunit G